VHKLAEMFEAASSMQDYSSRYIDRLCAMLQAMDAAPIAKMAEAMETASQAGKTIYFMANGGSAAVGSHWVNDLVAGGFIDGQPGFRAISLNDNGESVTCIGNDSAFEDIFVNQLKVHLDPGDVVYAMSVSGNSENIIRAIDYANERGATTIGISGFEGGRLKDRAQISLHIPSTKDEYGPVEDIFGILDHIVSGYLTMKRGKFLHH